MYHTAGGLASCTCAAAVAVAPGARARACAVSAESCVATTAASCVANSCCRGSSLLLRWSTSVAVAVCARAQAPCAHACSVSSM